MGDLTEIELTAEAQGAAAKANLKLLDVLGELAVAQERIVALEKALRAVEAINEERISDAEAIDRVAMVAEAALCDHRGECTHIEAT